MYSIARLEMSNDEVNRLIDQAYLRFDKKKQMSETLDITKEMISQYRTGKTETLPLDEFSRLYSAANASPRYNLSEIDPYETELIEPYTHPRTKADFFEVDPELKSFVFQRLKRTDKELPEFVTTDKIEDHSAGRKRGMRPRIYNEAIEAVEDLFDRSFEPREPRLKNGSNLPSLQEKDILSDQSLSFKELHLIGTRGKEGFDIIEQRDGQGSRKKDIGYLVGGGYEFFSALAENDLNYIKSKHLENNISINENGYLFSLADDMGLVSETDFGATQYNKEVSDETLRDYASFFRI